VYLLNEDGEIDYNTNYLSEIGEDYRSFFTEGLEEEQEVYIVYVTYCAAIKLIPGDVTGLSQATVTIKASVDSKREDAIEATVSFTIINEAARILDEKYEELKNSMEGS
jgi:hypothetical protein